MSNKRFETIFFIYILKLWKLIFSIRSLLQLKCVCFFLTFCFFLRLGVFALFLCFCFFLRLGVFAFFLCFCFFLRTGVFAFFLCFCFFLSFYGFALLWSSAPTGKKVGGFLDFFPYLLFGQNSLSLVKLRINVLSPHFFYLAAK